MFRKLIERLTDPRQYQNGRTRWMHVSNLRGSPGPGYKVQFAAGDVTDVQMDWISTLDGQPLTIEEVRTGFQMWLDTAPRSDGNVPLRTVQAWVDGSYREITFRTDWVPGFSVIRTR